MVERRKNIFLIGHGRRFVHLNKTGLGSAASNNNEIYKFESLA